MSTRLAIVDIDGVIADATGRFAKAEEAKQAYLNEMKELQITDDRGTTDTYWQTVFNPEHVPLDTLIEGADAAIEQLEKRYDVIYLTSRPERMRAATYEWLVDMRLSGPRIIMKASAFQYVKTVVWKAGMVQTLAALYHAHSVIFVDDEENAWTALKNAGPQPYALDWYPSLTAAGASRQAS